MNSLEALEIVKCILSNHQTMLEEKDKRFEFINIIKKDLERKEELEKENQELKELQELNKQGLWNLKQENKKLKKAIEILKDKPFVLEFGLSVFKWCEEEKIYYYYHEYTEYFGEDLEYRATEYILTQQEYKLLKEVLGDE